LSLTTVGVRAPSVGLTSDGKQHVTIPSDPLRSAHRRHRSGMSPLTALLLSDSTACRRIVEKRTGLSTFASSTLTLQTKQIIRRHQLLSTSKSCSCIRPDPSRRGRTHTITAGTSSYRTTPAVSHVIGNKPVRLVSHMENRLLLAIRCIDKQFSDEWSVLLRHSSFSHRRVAFRCRVGA
jgi:hypothetical protein